MKTSELFKKLFSSLSDGERNADAGSIGDEKLVYQIPNETRAYIGMVGFQGALRTALLDKIAKMIDVDMEMKLVKNWASSQTNDSTKRYQRTKNCPATDFLDLEVTYELPVSEAPSTTREQLANSNYADIFNTVTIADLNKIGASIITSKVLEVVEEIGSYSITLKVKLNIPTLAETVNAVVYGKKGWSFTYPRLRAMKSQKVLQLVQDYVDKQKSTLLQPYSEYLDFSSYPLVSFSANDTIFIGFNTRSYAHLQLYPWYKDDDKNQYVQFGKNIGARLALSMQELITGINLLLSSVAENEDN